MPKIIHGKPHNNRLNVFFCQQLLLRASQKATKILRKIIQFEGKSVSDISQVMVFLFTENSLHVGGEGNGTPCQYSCLENPMDGGASRLQSMGSLRVGHD